MTNCKITLVRQVCLQIGAESKVFYGNMCFVCERTVKEVPLKRCSSCKLISYCGADHQKLHWKEHSRLCKIIKRIESAWTPDAEYDDDSWYRYRTSVLMLSEIKMEQKLKPHEVNMILFPNNCAICHRQNNLKACMSCLTVNYCSQEHRVYDWSRHSLVCHEFALCFKLDLVLEKTGIFPSYQMRKTLFNLTDNIDKFMAEYIDISNYGYSDTMARALVSDFFSCPLTMLYGLSLTDYEVQENIVLHSVGSSFLETASLETWKTIIHVYPNVTSFTIYFIGPEVCENTAKYMCEICHDKIHFHFSRKYYHEFVKSSDYVAPDIITLFNCGFHEYQETDVDTWKMSIPFILKDDNVPLIFTSFTEREARLDSKLLSRSKKNLKMRILRNEFSSRRPHRDLEESGIYYNNQYLGVIYPKLRSF